MELLKIRDCEEIATVLYENGEDMDFRDYEETKEQTVADLIKALYQIEAIAENEYNKNYWRTLWNALQILNL